MFENNQRTELNDLGEIGLIEHLSGFFTNKHQSTLTGIGDDAAVLNIGNEIVLVSTCHLIEGIHFDLTFHPLKHLGYKAVVSAISNICAMNGKPREILVNLGLSNRFSLEAVEDLYSGIQSACEVYHLDLIGGDTSASQKGLFLNIVVLGRVEPDRITYRKGVSQNDLLVVTGDVGGAYMGLQVLEREKKVFLEHPQMQPDLDKNDYIVGRQLKPEARVDVVDLLASLDVIPTSMIDISNGLANELFLLGKKNNVGFDLYEDKLPIDPQTVDRAIEFGLNPSLAALNGGEDFELLFTIDQKNYDKIKGNADFTVIGHATEAVGKNYLRNQNGDAIEIKAQLGIQQRD